MAVFRWFNGTFGAEQKMLQLNHRSNRRIVQIIGDLTKAIQPNAVNVICARKNDPVPDNAAEFWQFADDESETNTIANYIANDIQANAGQGRVPDDFVLLVRVRANDYEKRFAKAFARRGLSLRNEARTVEGIAIQDLIVDDLVLLILRVIRLALGARGEADYGAVQEALSGILGTDFENQRDTRRLDGKLRALVDIFKSVTSTSPAEVDFTALLANFVAELGIEGIRRTFPQFEDASYLHKMTVALAVVLSEASKSHTESSEWSKVLDAVVGKGQVRLMAIHKSKGLEYHTVFFVGLHENALFGYKKTKKKRPTFFLWRFRGRGSESSLPVPLRAVERATSENWWGCSVRQMCRQENIMSHLYHKPYGEPR